jgi:acyl dehydratase
MPTADELKAAVEQLSQRIGQEGEPGEWYTVTQEAVNQFADVTGDHQWIHVDVERAKTGPYKGTIAHGFFTLSLVLQLGRRPQGAGEGGPGRGLGIQPRMAVNYGLNRVRFPAPVPVGKRIRGTSKLLSVEAVGDNCIQQVTQITVHVEGGDKPGCVAEMVGRMYF